MGILDIPIQKTTSSSPSSNITGTGLYSAARGDSPARRTIRSRTTQYELGPSKNFNGRFRGVDPTVVQTVLRNIGSANLDVAIYNAVDQYNGPSSGWVTITPGMEAVFGPTEYTKWVRSTDGTSKIKYEVEVELEVGV